MRRSLERLPPLVRKLSRELFGKPYGLLEFDEECLIIDQVLESHPQYLRSDIFRHGLIETLTEVAENDKGVDRPPLHCHRPL
jgi:hypothetical protein